MKIFIIFSFFTLLLFVFGCSRNEIDYGDIQVVSPEDAIVKINYASLYSDNRQVFIKFNGSRVTPLIYGRQPFPGGGYNTYGDVRADFLVVKPGDLHMSVVLPHKIDDGLDSLELYSADFKTEAGKRYTIHIADTAQFTRSLMSEEDFSMPDSGYARYRIINMMPNVPAIDLYYGQDAASTLADSLVAANVKYMEFSDYFTINRASTRTWKIRPAGAARTSATVLASYTSTNTLQNQRTYTVFALGYNGITAAPRKPYLSFFNIR